MGEHMTRMVAVNGNAAMAMQVAAAYGLVPKVLKTHERTPKDAKTLLIIRSGQKTISRALDKWRRDTREIIARDNVMPEGGLLLEDAANG